MNPSEKRVLEILSKKELVTKTELVSLLKAESQNGEISIGKLRSSGYIDQVQNLGNCYVITKAGLRALRADGQS